MLALLLSNQANEYRLIHIRFAIRQPNQILSNSCTNNAGKNHDGKATDF